jgi:CO/xanthine dehydrogenase FAD-binding subunit
MIIEYHRPVRIEDALDLLARPTPLTIPMGGGSYINRATAEDVAVVDLQSLNLNTIERKGKVLQIGATVVLQDLMHSNDIPSTLRQAVGRSASFNLRQIATIAGSLMAADGRSPLATTMLALDARLSLLPGGEQVSLGNLLPVRGEKLQGQMITTVSIPLNVQLGYKYVARTPADQPIVCAAVARWPSGRTRIALGGYGDAPLLAMDGSEASGAEIAARNAYSEAGDQWASSEYRSSLAEILTRRCLSEIAKSANE